MEASNHSSQDSLQLKMEPKGEQISESMTPNSLKENATSVERDERDTSFIPLGDLSNVPISADISQDMEASKPVNQLYLYSDSKLDNQKMEEMIRNGKVEQIIMVEDINDITNGKTVETPDGVFLEVNQSIVDQINAESPTKIIIKELSGEESGSGLTERLIDPSEHDITDEDIFVKDVTPEKELPPTFSLDDDFDDDSSGLLRGFSRDESEQKGKGSLLAKARKVSVGVAGGAMVLVGLPMIPAPTPGGVVVVGGGMALLATEFPAAARALDKTRERLAKAVAEDPDGHNDEADGKENAKSNSTPTRTPTRSKPENNASTEYSVTGTPLRQGSHASRHTKEYMDEVQEVRRRATKTMKDTKQSVKRFIRGNILPIMEKMSKRVNDEAKVGRSRTSHMTSKPVSSMRGNSNRSEYEI